MPETARTNKARGAKQYLGRYCMMPRMLFGSGLAAKLGKSVTNFYLALCEQANRNNGSVSFRQAGEFKASDRALASETGMSERDFRAYRDVLKENNLILFEREKGQSYTYTLLSQDLQWAALKTRPRKKLQPRGRLSPRITAENDLLNQKPTSRVKEVDVKTSEDLRDFPDRDMVRMFPSPVKFARPYSSKVS